MSVEKRPLSPAQRRHILWENALLPGLLIALMWGLYLLSAIFDVDLLRYLQRRRQPGTPFMYLVLACGVTVGSLLWAAYYVHRAWLLATRGVEVVATIKRVGRLKAGGMVRVDYEFWLNGLLIRQAMSCHEEAAEEYRRGTKPLVLVCDPRRPQRSLERSLVWPDAEPGDSPHVGAE
jgi:hypothetical protein